MEIQVHGNYTNKHLPVQMSLPSNEQQAFTTADNDEHRELGVKSPIDFISTLPFDIVSCVLPHLPKQQLLECMKVNKTWRTQVMECHEAWQDIEVSSSGGTLNNLLFFSIVTQIQANHVRHLELVDPGDQWIKTLGDLQSLHTLLIKSTQLSSTSLFIESIKKISSSLRRLQVTIRVSADETLVPAIWSTCTRLTHLAIIISRMGSGATSDSIELPVLPDLIDLSLYLHYLDNIPNPFDDISTILRACPNLEYYCNGNEQYPVTVLNQIYQHCPKLRRLTWKDFPLGAKAWDNSNNVSKPSATTSEPTGLSEVNMWLSSNDIIHGDQIYLFLDRSRDTLKKLAIYGPTSAGSQPTAVELLHWNIFSDFKAHQLHTLTFKRLEINTSIMVSILKQCQELRAITFVSMRELKDSIFDALIDLTHLEKLHITKGCRGLTPIGLTAFLDSIANPSSSPSSSSSLSGEIARQQNFSDSGTHPSTKSILKDVQFDSHLITSSSITALANVSSLEKLHLSVNRDLTIEKQLDELPKNLINLVEIKMFTIAACTDTFLSNLSHSKRLTRVELLALNQASDQGIIQLVDRCESLKYIAVRVCPMISQDAISYAQQQNICVRYAEIPGSI